MPTIEGRTRTKDQKLLRQTIVTGRIYRVLQNILFITQAVFDGRSGTYLLLLVRWHLRRCL